MAFLSVFAGAQNVMVKGICRDEGGRPIARGTVKFQNLATGQKISATTGERGEYTTVDVMPGTYKVTLFDSSSKQLFYFDRAELKANSQYNVDFNLAELRADAEKQAGAEQQRTDNEKIQQENEKIRGVNALLLQAAQQKKEKHYAAALATLQQAAAQDQTHDVVYGALGDALMLNQKYPEAEAAYAKAITLAPPGSKSVANYHSGIALADVQETKMEPGMGECDKAAQVNVQEGSVCYFNVGAVLTNQDKPDAANQAFDKAIGTDPTRADAYYHKGANLLNKATLGSDNKIVPAPGTVEALSKYLELAPEGPYAQSARDMLARLGAPVQTTYSEQKNSGKKK